MSNGRGLSANDFRIEFRKITAAYRGRFEPQIAELRAKYANPTRRIDPRLEQALEAHVRTYVIDKMLEALRWVITPTVPEEIENMIPEAQVDPVTGARRFMDYLGFEQEVDTPLLVVEAKRPTEFPMPPNGSMDIAPVLMIEWLRDPNVAPPSWNEWLPSLRDYVQAVFQRSGRYPVRTAITDGNWLVVFERPEDAFAHSGQPNPDFIHVFMNAEEIIKRYNLVFSLLDQREVSRQSREVSPGGLRGVVDPNKVTRLLHALQVTYSTTGAVGHRLVPTISVMAVIVLRSETGTWLKVAPSAVNANDIRFFPRRVGEIARHLEEVRADAGVLLERVQHWLGRPLAPTSLVDHYSDTAFEGMHGVENLPGREGDFWVVTGQATHFLLSAPQQLVCPFHEFGPARERQCQAFEAPLINPALSSPRAFFTNGAAHHCCHDDVFSAKHVLIDAGNLERCGVRSGGDKDVFCEIAPVEEVLCCRLCAFQEVCSSSEILALPCEAP